MPSPDSSTKRASSVTDALLGGHAPREVRRDAEVRSVEEFVAFLEALEAVFGPDDRPRPPTLGDRFLL